MNGISGTLCVCLFLCACFVWSALVLLSRGAQRLNSSSLGHVNGDN